MSAVYSGSEAKLHATEVRLGVRFPSEFRRAVEQPRVPHRSSRYTLLDLDEVDTTRAWGVPGEGVVVARSIGGGFVVFRFAADSGPKPRPLAEVPFLWEPEDHEALFSGHQEREHDDSDCGEDDSEWSEIGASFDDVLDPRTLEERLFCPRCGSDNRGFWPCRACGLRHGQTPPRDRDRETAEKMVRALVDSGGLVVRTARSVQHVVYETAEALHGVHDDSEAARRILEVWEDMPEVEEIFVNEDAIDRHLCNR